MSGVAANNSTTSRLSADTGVSGSGGFGCAAATAGRITRARRVRNRRTGDSPCVQSRCEAYNLPQSRPDFRAGTLPMLRLLPRLPLGLVFLAATPAPAQKDPPVPDTVSFEKGI